MRYGKSIDHLGGAGVIVLAASCETMDSVMEGAVTVKGVTERAGSVSAETGAVDFKQGEQLCSCTDRDNEDVEQDIYRGVRWRFGTVTSIDDLFNEMVEVNGEAAYIEWLRVTDEPIG